MRSFIQRTACLVVGVVACAGSATADVPPAGTIIDARAEAVYINTNTGLLEQVFSNTVQVLINEYPAIRVEPDQTTFVSPGLNDQYVFFVENIGNADLNPALTLNQPTNDDYQVQNTRIFRDLNGNGLIEAGEPEIASGDVIALAPGERGAFVVTFQVPSGTVGEGDQSLVDFIADDAVQNAASQATGTAIVSEGGLIVFKRASRSVISAGDPLAYTIALRNNGTIDIQPYARLEGVDLIVDGQVTSGVIFRDDIPQHTAYQGIGQTSTFTPLYHLAGTPDKHTYQTAEPADPSQVEAVAFIYDPDDSLATADAFPVGFSADVEFAVRANDNAGGLLARNRAETYQPTGAGLEPRPSNIVETPISGPGGTLRFVNGTFTQEVDRIPTDTNTFVEVSAGICNLDPAVTEVITITIRTDPDGDLETVTATETGGPNSGLFRTGPIPVEDQSPPVQANNVVSGLKRTIMRASVVCGGQTLSDTQIVNDGGFAFNSLNNAPVPNVSLTLTPDGGRPVASVITDADGFFQFIDVTPGTYTLGAFDPGGLVFPSRRLIFPGFDRDVGPDASYGRPFPIDGPTPFWGIDVPLDPDPQSALMLMKTADKDRVATGDFIEYTIELANTVDFGLSNTEIIDTLPVGFAYVDRSARLDGVAIADPANAPGPQLTFDLGAATLAPASTAELSYVVRVLPGAGQGERFNTAVASAFIAGGTALQSNTDRHRVVIDNARGVFADEGVVVGKVWLDVNGNGIQDVYSRADVKRNDDRAGVDGAEWTEPDEVVAEPGIAGVRIYLQDGRSVVTDENGLYSLPGLEPKTHVLVVENVTLPAGTGVQLARTRDALGAGSRFIDVKRGELRTEDFPIGPGTSEALAQIEERGADFEGLAIGDSLLRTGLPLSGATNRTISAARQGELGTTTQIVNRNGRQTTLSQALPDLPPVTEVARTIDLEATIKDQSSELAFLDLDDGDTVADDRISIRVKGPASVGLALEVNGERVSSGQLGQRAVYQAGDVQAAEYVAVQLAGGANAIRLVQTDPFGNDRGGIEITIYAPGQPTGLDVIVPAEAIADPGTPVPVVVRVTDDEGRLTGTPIEVTLDASRGAFDVTDIRENDPGVQAYIDNGEAVFDYIPPSLAGSHRITVKSSIGTYTAEIRLTPDLNTRMAAGIIEGAVRFGEGGQSLAPLVEDDQLSTFEDTIEGVRGALYLKGRIRGDALLTLRYESDRDSQDRLFRDVNPNDHYPVYGDNSERGFDAQSNSELFVKVEKGLSYVLYGDINIAPQSKAIKLGSYSRSVTGGHLHLENERVRIDLFAAYTDQDQVIREFRGRGISGPYDVDLTGYIENSEVVEIVTYDRDQPSVEIGRVRLTRFSDYTLDFFDDAILFNRPIPSVDENLNPQFIRITYEVEDGDGDRYWVYGGEVGVDVTDNVTVGYREVRSEGDAAFDQDRRMVRSGYAELDLGRFGRAEIEAAQTENADGETGQGYRAEYELRAKRGRLKLSAADTGIDFDAPGSSVAEGRTEFNAQGEFKLNDKFSLAGEALYTRDKIDDERRYGAEARINARISPQLGLTGGTRYVITDRPGDDDDEIWSGIIGLTYRPRSIEGLVVELEYEQDFEDWANRRFLIDSSYQYSPNLRAYNTTEWSSSDTGAFGLGDGGDLELTSRAGFEITWNDQITSRTEHREGTDGGLANALDWSWTWRDWHTLSAKIEHVEPLKPDHDRNTAVTLGYRYENEAKTKLADSQLEWSRTDGGNQSWYGRLGYGQRFGDWTFLVENRFAHTGGDGGDRLRNRLRAGYAHRPVDNNRFASLGWYGFEFDDDQSAGSRAMTHEWALGGAYQASPDLRLRARHAGRHRDQLYGAADAGSTVLLGTAGLEWDAHERIVLGANGTVFWDDFGAVNYGLGGEIGFVPAENTLVSVGYNWAGIDEDKIRDIHRTGVYLRVRAKFDEGLWNIFDRAGISGQ